MFYLNSSKALNELVSQCRFVGLIDNERTMVQHKNHLWVIQHSLLSRELIFQNFFNRFGKFNKIFIRPKTPIFDIVHMSLQVEPNLLEDFMRSELFSADGEFVQQRKVERSNINLVAVAQQIVTALCGDETKRQMFLEYFSMQIEEPGILSSLPEIVDNYIPPLEKLGEFFIQLVTKVNWNDEKPCFLGVASCSFFGGVTWRRCLVGFFFFGWS